jgi:hypothetical protein
VIKSEISVQAKLLAFATGLSRRLSWATENITCKFSKASSQFWLEQRIMMARRESLYAATVAVGAFMSESESEGCRGSSVADAHLLLCKPTSAFRKAAYSTGLIEHKTIRKRWFSRDYRLIDIKIPNGHPARHDVDGQKLFYTVAGEIMARYFPSEAWIVALDNKNARSVS